MGYPAAPYRRLATYRRLASGLVLAAAAGRGDGDDGQPTSPADSVAEPPPAAAAPQPPTSAAAAAYAPPPVFRGV